MSWEKCFANEFSNDVEKYEIEVTKTSQNKPLFLTVYILRPCMHCKKTSVVITDLGYLSFIRKELRQAYI